MPVAIIMSRQGAIPAIIAEDSVVALVNALQGLAEAPTLGSERAARQWLQELPQPSGWFETAEEATAHVRRFAEPVPTLSGDEVREAREALEMTRAEFAAAVGIGGNSNTQHQAIYKIETDEVDKKSGKKRILGREATLRLRALMAERGLQEAAE